MILKRKIINNVKHFFKRFVPATYKKVESELAEVKHELAEVKQSLLRVEADFPALVDFIRFSEIRFEALRVHRNVFPKYKDLLRGKDVAIIGTGPTLDKWVPPPGCIQMGVNSAIVKDNLDLSYYFVSDYHEPLFDAIRKKKERVKIFCNVNYLQDVPSIPLAVAEELGAESFYCYDQLRTDFFPYYFTMDISEKPFIAYFSTIFIPMQFALWTHPRRIYIVGCDCTGGHFSGNITRGEGLIYSEGLIYGWRKMKDFAKKFYPDVEIISVNPVGLKGIFYDYYTK